MMTRLNSVYLLILGLLAAHSIHASQVLEEPKVDEDTAFTKSIVGYFNSLASTGAPLGANHGSDNCKTSSECTNYPYFVCVDSQCEHKAVFPQEPLEIVGLFVFGFIMALCTVAGIGGGGIAISMLIAFWKFDTKPAVAISSFSILVCTTMRFFYNFRSKHP